MKTIKQFYEEYKPKAPDEQKFANKHVVAKVKDRNGNGDDVFNATNVKTIKRASERHGYDTGDDVKVYEDVENLDELSKSTLKSYAHASQSDLENSSEDRGYHGRGDSQSDREKFVASRKNMRKRSKGLGMAINKLAKEDIINNALETYMKESYKPLSLEDQFIELTDSLTESTAAILLTLFDSLNESNQVTMIAKLQEENGASDLVDFIINNKDEI